MRQKTVACLILAAVAFGICAMWLFAPTLAHNENTASWQGGLQFLKKTAITSNLLSAKGQTVVIGQMSQTQTVEIQLICEGGVPEGIFTYTASDGYVAVDFGQPQVSGSMLTVDVTFTQAVTLDAAHTETVQIVWTPDDNQSELLWADFQVPIVPESENSENLPDNSDTPKADKNLIAVCGKNYSNEMPIALTLSPNPGYTIWLSGNDEPFPAMTRYTINGKTVVLYDGGEIPIQADQSVTVLVDVSRTPLASAASCEVTASVNQGDQKYTHTVELNRIEHGHFVQPDDPLILTVGNTLDLLAKNRWEVCSNAYTLYRLETDNNGEIGWVKLEEAQSGIQRGENGAGNICLFIAEGSRPLAGTYMLRLARIFGDTEVFCEEIAFFVQYDRANIDSMS